MATTTPTTTGATSTTTGTTQGTTSTPLPSVTPIVTDTTPYTPYPSPTVPDTTPTVPDTTPYTPYPSPTDTTPYPSPTETPSGTPDSTSPNGGTNDAGFTFGSNNTAVASVDKNGVITAIGNGETTINVSYPKLGSKQVTVKVMTYLTSLSLTGSNTVSVGSKTAMTVSYNPTNTSSYYKAVQWTSSNPAVATVDGDGNEIKIFEHKNYVFKSIGMVAKENGITEKEVYYKYSTKIVRTTMPQSSIRPRVMEKLSEINYKNDLSFTLE